jgi:FixJ family two-component response regulator
MPKPAPVVYIVDGDESVKQALIRLIESAGLQAKPCTCLEDLLRQAAGGPTGCALVDLASPGVEEAAMLSRLLAAAAVLPVIALSARDDRRVRRMAREMGAKAFFRKPVDSAALLDSIDWVAREAN